MAELLAPERLPERDAWNSFEWQRAKRLLASAIARCLCSVGCRVYVLDMHGGEPSEGLGGKDVDLAVEGCRLDPAALEELLERLARDLLRRATGRDPYRLLGIPNIIEVHSTREFVVEKYVRLGPPYSVPLCP